MRYKFGLIKEYERAVTLYPNYLGELTFMDMETKEMENIAEITSVGSLSTYDIKKFKKPLKKLEHIKRNASFDDLESAKGLESLKSIGGSATFFALKSAKGLKNLTSIGGYAIFSALKNAKGLENLQYIGDSATFSSLQNAKGLKNLKYIGGDAHFNHLKSIRGLEGLKVVDGDIYCYDMNKDELLKLRDQLEIFNSIRTRYSSIGPRDDGFIPLTKKMQLKSEVFY